MSFDAQRLHYTEALDEASGVLVCATCTSLALHRDAASNSKAPVRRSMRADWPTGGRQHWSLKAPMLRHLVGFGFRIVTRPAREPTVVVSSVRGWIQASKSASSALSPCCRLYCHPHWANNSRITFRELLTSPTAAVAESAEALSSYDAQQIQVGALLAAELSS